MIDNMLARLVALLPRRALCLAIVRALAIVASDPCSSQADQAEDLGRFRVLDLLAQLEGAVRTGG